MLDLVAKTAQKLEAEGFSAGDRVAVCSESCIEYYVLTLACWKIGAAMVPVSTRYPDQKIRLALDGVACKELFISRSLKKKIAGCRCRNLEEMILCQEYETNPVTFEQLQLDLSQDAGILFTSGSSAGPKGVLHTIGSHYYNALGALQNISFESADRWLMSLPMYHISGFSLIMRSLIAGGTIVFPKSDESMSDAILNRKITHLSLVPAQLNQLIKNQAVVRALRQCKSVLLGGASSDPALVQRSLDQGLAISTTYGSTEAASQVATMTPQTQKQKPEASGKVLAYRDLMIADDGEMLLKGRILFKGYVVKDKLQLPLDKQGYFHTGDIGVLDDEGFLTVLGRKDRMFISGGENIYPEEIEKSILATNLATQVFVVSIPDAVMGHRPVAFIKSPPDSPSPDPEAIKTKLQAHLERFKVPDYFLPWPELESESLKPDTVLFSQIALKEAARRNL